MTGPELRSRSDVRLDDWRRRNLLAAPDSRRINPEPLLRATPSAMAFWQGSMGGPISGSGSCSGVGGCEIGRWRPRGPSGDDWSEVYAEGYAGVDTVEGPPGLCTDRGVILRVGNVNPGCSGGRGANHEGGGGSGSELISPGANGGGREGAIVGFYVSSQR